MGSRLFKLNQGFLAVQYILNKGKIVPGTY
jgi:hypothetical protein